MLLLCDLAVELGSRARKGGDEGDLVRVCFPASGVVAARTRHGRVSLVANHPLCRWVTFGAGFAATAGREEEDWPPERREGGQRQQGFVEKETSVWRLQCVKEALSSIDAEELDLAGGREVIPAAGNTREDRWRWNRKRHECGMWRIVFSPRGEKVNAAVNVGLYRLASKRRKCPFSGTKLHVVSPL